MWLLTDQGCFRIERDAMDAGSGLLSVASPVRADLEALAPLLEGMGPIEKLDGDAVCPFRARAPREKVALAFAERLFEVNYSDFSSAVRSQHGRVRLERYAGAAAHLYDLAAVSVDQDDPSGANRRQ